jgi:hypothetical protein
VCVLPPSSLVFTIAAIAVVVLAIMIAFLGSAHVHRAWVDKIGIRGVHKRRSSHHHPHHHHRPLGKVGTTHVSRARVDELGLRGSLQEKKQSSLPSLRFLSMDVLPRLLPCCTNNGGGPCCRLKSCHPIFSPLYHIQGDNPNLPWIQFNLSFVLKFLV